MMRKVVTATVLIVLYFWQLTFGCQQAWNGGGTGAWYRVDTSCDYSFTSTYIIYCLPTVQLTCTTDGFYVSLGVYNRLNGVGLDVGLTYDWKMSRWSSYANDNLGWKSGSILIDPLINTCYNVSLNLIDGNVHYEIRRENDSTPIGHDIFDRSQIDPLLNLTVNSSNFGFYRFDSIAQAKETLKSGSQMSHSVVKQWIFQFFSGEIISADQVHIASNVRGYAPGPCCTANEIDTIKIHQQTKWNQSNISIFYF